MSRIKKRITPFGILKIIFHAVDTIPLYSKGFLNNSRPRTNLRSSFFLNDKILLFVKFKNLSIKVYRTKVSMKNSDP